MSSNPNSLQEADALRRELSALKTAVAVAETVIVQAKEHMSQETQLSLIHI